MNYELQFRQTFAKLRQILGSNYAGAGKHQVVCEEGEEGSFYRRGGGSPLFMVVTPTSWW
jgi:hypothetical protein